MYKLLTQPQLDSGISYERYATTQKCFVGVDKDIEVSVKDGVATFKGGYISSFKIGEPGEPCRTIPGDCLKLLDKFLGSTSNIFHIKIEPLTINISDSFILDPYMGRYRLTLAKLVSLETRNSLPPIRIDGDLKVFINKGNSFSLAISVDELKEEFFKRLEYSLPSLASTVIPSTKPESFKLIKESKNYCNVYCKIYTYPSGAPKCYYSELVSGKCRSKPLEDAAFGKFNGSCVVRIIHTFSGKTKGITICTDEILNYNSKKSYFDEYPEEKFYQW